MRRENDVRQALEAQKKKVLDLKYQHDQAAVFLSDVTAAQRDLDEVTQRLAQSNLESLTQQTNVVQLSTASVPKDPSSPKLVINLILAIFLGGVLGIGSAWRSKCATAAYAKTRISSRFSVCRCSAESASSTFAPAMFESPRAASGRLEPSVI